MAHRCLFVASAPEAVVSPCPRLHLLAVSVVLFASAILLAVLPPSRVVAAVCPRECSLSMRFPRATLLEISHIASSFSAHTSVHNVVFLEVSLPNSLTVLSDQSASASSYSYPIGQRISHRSRASYSCRGSLCTPCPPCRT